MHKWSAVGAPHYNQTQESEEEGKISTYWEDFSPELPLTGDFSGKLDYLLLPHYLVSLLPFLTGLFPNLLHVARAGCFCIAAHAQQHWADFQRNNESVLHVPSGVHSTVPEHVWHCSGLHSPALSKTQPSHGLYSYQEAEPTTNMRLAWKDNALFLATLNTNKEMECVPHCYTPIPLCMPTAPEYIHRQPTLLCCSPTTQCTEIATSISH